MRPRDLIFRYPGTSPPEKYIVMTMKTVIGVLSIKPLRERVYAVRIVMTMLMTVPITRTNNVFVQPLRNRE